MHGLSARTAPRERQRVMQLRMWWLAVQASAHHVRQEELMTIVIPRRIAKHALAQVLTRQLGLDHMAV